MFVVEVVRCCIVGETTRVQFPAQGVSKRDSLMFFPMLCGIRGFVLQHPVESGPNVFTIPVGMLFGSKIYYTVRLDGMQTTV